MTARAGFHVTVVPVALCCLLAATLGPAALVMAGLNPASVARFHITGPPEAMHAARWVPPIAWATAVCAAGALALATRALARASRET